MILTLSNVEGRVTIHECSQSAGNHYRGLEVVKLGIIKKEIKMKGTCEVLIVHHPPGIIQGCKKCRVVLSTGKYAIGLKIKDRGREFSYFLGEDPPRVCCGEEKILIRTFESEEAAKIPAGEVRRHLAEKESTEGLRLLDWTLPHNN